MLICPLPKTKHAYRSTLSMAKYCKPAVTGDNSIQCLPFKFHIMVADSDEQVLCLFAFHIFIFPDLPAIVGCQSLGYSYFAVHTIFFWWLSHGALTFQGVIRVWWWSYIRNIFWLYFEVEYIVRQGPYRIYLCIC